MNVKIAAYVGFAIKKGKVIFGAERLVSGGRIHPKVVLMSQGTGRSTFNAVARFCALGNVSLYLVKGENLFDYAKKDVKVLTVADKGLGAAIIKEIEENSPEEFNIYTEVQPIDNENE